MTSTGFISEEINNNFCYDLVIDSAEGTTQIANTGSEAMSVMAISSHNSFYTTGYYYMNKLVVGPKIAKHIILNILDPVERIIQLVAKVLDKSINNILACILNRPRHNELINKIRNLGCKIKLINDCDISSGVASCLDDSGIDLAIGIGGNTEGIITASAVKCLGGDFQCVFCDNNAKPINNTVYNTNDLIKDRVLFIATGILNGMLFRGVKYFRSNYVTHSLLLDSFTKSIQRIETFHYL